MMHSSKTAPSPSIQPGTADGTGPAQQAKAQLAQAEESRRASEERYRTLFDLGPVAVYSCDASGVIREFNLRAAELWGRAPKPGDTDERFCGSHQMYRPDGTHMPHDQCPMAEVLAGTIPEARDMEVQIKRPDGSRVTVIVNIRVLKNDRGDITGAINCFVDITDRKRMQEELKHFAYAAAHDLQEPLRMVTIYAQLLARDCKGRLGETADQYIDYTVQGAHRMDALLKGMRDYWQASERGESHRALTDTDSMLEQALLNLQESITASGAKITHDPLPVVLADETAFVQVYQNLIGNAIKYCGDQPPHVHISAVRNAAGEWLFSVKDDGIGIDPQFAEKVFVVFNRLNGNKYPGSGIGLSLCRKVIEHLGGSIWVESAIGQGATFKFTIPCRD
jgi:PAS domain S-box-containing protein